MEGAKINNLGLWYLIRLCLFVEYLSFLGGETQRPFLNNRSRAIPAQYPLKSFHQFYKNTINEILVQKEEFLISCPLHDPSSSVAVRRLGGRVFIEAGQSS